MQKPETEEFWGDLTKVTVAIVCFNRFKWKLAIYNCH